MATKIQKMKWNLYQEKQRLLTNWGIITGHIRMYDKALIERLRNIYDGGIPLSILLLVDKMCNGFCYERALLLTLGLADENFRVIDATIDGIALNPDYIDESSQEKSESFGEHRFVEVKSKDGKTYIYDTSAHLIYEKWLYQLIEKPRINKIITKEELIPFHKYHFESQGNNDKYALPLILPMIESYAQTTTHFNRKTLVEEIELFKQTIGYDQICQEVHEDMKRRGFKI